jgi:hypothetical protein
MICHMCWQFERGMPMPNVTGTKYIGSKVKRY